MRLLSPTIVLGLVAFAVTGIAAERGDPAAQITAQHRALLDLKGPARSAAVDQLVDRVAMARAVAGPVALSATERPRLEAALGRIARHRYLKALGQFGDRPATGVVRPSGTSNRVTIVPGPAPDRPEFAITLETRRGKMRVIDIYTERASLVKTYRSQFRRVTATPPTTDVATVLASVEKDAAAVE